MSEQHKIDMGVVRGEPYFNLHADTAEELKKLMEDLAPVYKTLVVQQNAEKPIQTPQNASQSQSCPKCGGEMWDNRPKKQTGEFKFNSPDFKCKDKNCGGVIWPQKA